MKTIMQMMLVVSLGSAWAQTESKPAGKKDQAAWTKTPSRYLGASEGDFVQAMAVRLAISGRDVGPFGLSQDLSNEPKGPIVLKSRKKPKKAQMAFSKMVSMIDVSTVNIAEKCFYVGGRDFRIGQEFPLMVDGEEIKVRVDSVRKNRISFKNLKTGELANKSLNVLPPGMTRMTRGNEQIDVMGVTPNGGGEDAPLIINVPTPNLNPSR